MKYNSIKTAPKGRIPPTSIVKRTLRYHACLGTTRGTCHRHGAGTCEGCRAAGQGGGWACHVSFDRWVATCPAVAKPNASPCKGKGDEKPNAKQCEEGAERDSTRGAFAPGETRRKQGGERGSAEWIIEGHDPAE